MIVSEHYHSITWRSYLKKHFNISNQNILELNLSRNHLFHKLVTVNPGLNRELGVLSVVSSLIY